MTRKFAYIFASVIVVMAEACSKHDPAPQLMVEIPADLAGISSWKWKCGEGRGSGRTQYSAGKQLLSFRHRNSPVT